MGEKDTIVNYPDQIEALVAAGNDPIVSRVNRAELRAIISPFGFRRSFRVQPDDLRRSPYRPCWCGATTTPSEESTSPK